MRYISGVEPKAITRKEKLRRALNVSGLSQRDADKATESSRGTTYNLLERLKRDVPDAYIVAIAEHLGISPAWFDDGVDDWPVGQSVSGSVPVVALLPADPRSIGAPVDTIKHAIDTEGAAFYRIDEDRKPYLRRGDDVLVVPSDAKRSGVIVLAQGADVLDIYQTVRVGADIKVIQLCDDQPPAPPEWVQAGVAIEVHRRLPSGLVIIYKCATGLAPDMLTF